MKLLLSTFVLLISAAASAQVNLDQRITVSQHDIVFQSMNEPNVAYMMPSGLTRLSDITVVHAGPRVTVQFDVGIAASEFARIDDLIAKAGKPTVKSSILRAVEAEIMPKSALDIDARFDPKVSVAGDVANLAGPLRYVLSVKNVVSRGQNQTAKMLTTLFSAKGVDDIAQIKLTFDAVCMGQPFKGQTAVSVFVGARDSAPPLVVPRKGLGSMALAAGEISIDGLVPELNPSVASVQFVEDKIAGCWNQPRSGVICLK